LSASGGSLVAERQQSLILGNTAVCGKTAPVDAHRAGTVTG
jgi:hypothetical protein